jgi:hypothetical protein
VFRPEADFAIYCSKYRIWQRSFERYLKTCTRSQFKRAKETKAQKKAAQKGIDDYNGEHETNTRIEWVLETAMRRLRLNRNVGGRKPTWKYTAACGAMTQTGKAGGIDAIVKIYRQST